MKYYAIPDLHGRYDLLEKSLQKIEDIQLSSDDGNFRVVALGDYIDRGPQSRQIIQRLMEEQEKRPDRFICLKGNHEDMMVRTIREPLMPNWWISNGGDATLKSYGAEDQDDRHWNPYGYHLGKVNQDHLNWLEKLPLFFETEKHVFVHAGVPVDDLDLKDQNEEQLMWMLYHKNDKGGYRDKHVVHGHHIHEDGPHEWEYRTSLDTGSFYTNRQVIGVFDDTQGRAKEFIEVTNDP